MTRKSTKGTKQLGAEVLAELVDEFKRFCESRGETLRHHLEMAMRRHLDNPPPVVTPPPLPPLPPPALRGEALQSSGVKPVKKPPRKRK